MIQEKRSESKKLIPVYLQKLFLEKTDKNHFIRMPEILSFLETKGIYADRRTIYSAISLLNTAGFEIVGIQEKGGYKYHHPNRTFNTNELKFLIDSVAASKFLTERKSKELIEKIKSLGCIYNKESLNRNVLLGNRIKSMNDKVLKNLDTIYAAIGNNRKIIFKYVKWTPERKFVLKRKGQPYSVSPFAVTLNDDNYYLIAYDDKYLNVRHYRIDKMQSINISPVAREGIEYCKQFNIAEYKQKTFGMYGGREETVSLIAPNDLAGVFIDRFGSALYIRKNFDDPNTFITKIDVAVSPQFFGWLCGLGSHVRIISPDTVKDEYTNYLLDILSNYNRTEP